MPTSTAGAPRRKFPKRVSILGPGLIGGSILLAIRERMPDAQLAVWSRAADELAEVRRRGLADVATHDVSATIRNAELVVLCTPVGAMARVAAEFATQLAPAAVVTDVGSVKAPVVSALNPLFTDAETGLSRFVGGHPMAGREVPGLAAAHAGLFEGATCLLTPEPTTLPAARERVTDFWMALGIARVHSLPATEHDAVVALVSHLPHLLAAALLETVGTAHPDALACSGPGLRSVTRPAAGPPELWTEILSSNRGAVKSALHGFLRQLKEFAADLDADDAEALTARLRSAAARRRELPESNLGKK